MSGAAVGGVLRAANFGCCFDTSYFEALLTRQYYTTRYVVRHTWDCVRERLVNNAPQRSAAARSADQNMFSERSCLLLKLLAPNKPSALYTKASQISWLKMRRAFHEISRIFSSQEFLLPAELSVMNAGFRIDRLSLPAQRKRDNPRGSAEISKKQIIAEEGRADGEEPEKRKTYICPPVVSSKG